MSVSVAALCVVLRSGVASAGGTGIPPLCRRASIPATNRCVLSLRRGSRYPRGTGGCGGGPANQTVSLPSVVSAPSPLLFCTLLIAVLVVRASFAFPSC